ncbi:hypothetical protein CC79DRAFT_1276983 [Sarocladium strictum]
MLDQDTTNPDANPNAIVTDAPSEQSRLTFVDAACLVINRMIGTGIYSSPRTVISGTRSAGGAILLWLLGTLCSLAGVHVYIEYGLNVPRFVIDGAEQAVPRSGGDLHYLSYVYRWPYYAKGTVLYIACLYGISFICVGNMAGNCVNFGIRVLAAANPGLDPSHAEVSAIATAAGLFSCLIHAVSRRGGILLNDVFAVIKVCILLIIPCATFAVLAKAVEDEDGIQVPNVFGDNMDPEAAFKPPEGSPAGNTSLSGYAAAYLSILFAFGGIEQSNHVLGEIKSPRRTFPRALTFAVALVGVLYMVVNLCYMTVVPANEQTQNHVALLFFRKVFGRNKTDVLPDRIFNSFLALSSFGNIIVTTYTAARMKQEIAKQGFIPFARFFATNTDVSIGRLVKYLRNDKGWTVPFFSLPEEHQEATPVGALVLHMVACLVLIWSTYGFRPDDAYGILTNFSAYLITAFFGMFLALGILILRFYGPPATEAARTQKDIPADTGTIPGGRRTTDTWQDMVGTSVHKWLSIPTAILYFLGTAFPVGASWYKGTSSFGYSKAGWAVVPAVCWVILGIASFWWLGFVLAGRYRQHRKQEILRHEVWPKFEWAEPTDSVDRYENEIRSEERRHEGGKILVHETVLFAWQADDTLRSSGGVPNTAAAQDASSGRLPDGIFSPPPPPASPFAPRRPNASHRTRPEDGIDDVPLQDFSDPRWNAGRTGRNVRAP